MDSTNRLTYSRLIRLFVPLSLSDMILVASAPLVGATLSRLPDSHTHLAAYGAAQAVALLVESPVIMLLHAATAGAANPASYRTLHRLMVALSLLTTLVMLALTLTPLKGFVFERLLGLPAGVAAEANTALASLILWPAAIAWRRYYQGWLIRRGRSRQVMIAGLSRLAAMVITLVTGAYAGLPGALVGGLALQIGVMVEGCAVRFLARDAGVYHGDEGESAVPSSMGALIRWYLPLAATSMLVYATRPLMTAGIARGALPVASLAAWPVVSGTYSLLANGTRMVQQLTISLGQDAAARRTLFRFTVGVGIIFTALLALLAFTPLAGLYLETVAGTTLLDVALPTLRVAVLFPLLAALQSGLQGLLIRSGQTVRVNAAAFVNSVVSIALITVMAPRLPFPGAPLASAAMTAALAAEVAVLAYLRPREGELGF